MINTLAELYTDEQFRGLDLEGRETAIRNFARLTGNEEQADGIVADYDRRFRAANGTAAERENLTRAIQSEDRFRAGEITREEHLSDLNEAAVNKLKQERTQRINDERFQQAAIRAEQFGVGEGDSFLQETAGFIKSTSEAVFGQSEQDAENAASLTAVRTSRAANRPEGQTVEEQQAILQRDFDVAKSAIRQDFDGPAIILPNNRIQLKEDLIFKNKEEVKLELSKTNIPKGQQLLFLRDEFDGIQQFRSEQFAGILEGAASRAAESIRRQNGGELPDSFEENLRKEGESDLDFVNRRLGSQRETAGPFGGTVIKSLSKAGATITGLADGLFLAAQGLVDPEGAEENAQEAAQTAAANAILTGEIQGNEFISDIVGQLPNIAPAARGAQLGGRLAQAFNLGTRGTRVAQTAGIAAGSFASAGSAQFLDSAGSLKDGEGLSRAYTDAFKAGGIEAVMSALGSGGGVEAVLRGGLGQKLRQEFGKRVVRLGVNVGEEAIEEGLTEALQFLAVEMQRNPNASADQLAESIGQGALIGATLGGGFNAFQQVGEVGNNFLENRRTARERIDEAKELKQQGGETVNESSDSLQAVAENGGQTDLRQPVESLEEELRASGIETRQQAATELQRLLEERERGDSSEADAQQITQLETFLENEIEPNNETNTGGTQVSAVAGEPTSNTREGSENEQEQESATPEGDGRAIGSSETTNNDSTQINNAEETQNEENNEAVQAEGQEAVQEEEINSELVAREEAAQNAANLENNDDNRAESSTSTESQGRSRQDNGEAQGASEGGRGPSGQESTSAPDSPNQGEPTQDTSGVPETSAETQGNGRTESQVNEDSGRRDNNAEGRGLGSDSDLSVQGSQSGDVDSNLQSGGSNPSLQGDGRTDSANNEELLSETRGGNEDQGGNVSEVPGTNEGREGSRREASESDSQRDSPSREEGDGTNTNSRVNEPTNRSATDEGSGEAQASQTSEGSTENSQEALTRQPDNTDAREDQSEQDGLGDIQNREGTSGSNRGDVAVSQGTEGGGGASNQGGSDTAIGRGQINEQTTSNSDSSGSSPSPDSDGNGGSPVAREGQEGSAELERAVGQTGQEDDSQLQSTPTQASQETSSTSPAQAGSEGQVDSPTKDAGQLSEGDQLVYRGAFHEVKSVSKNEDGSVTVEAVAVFEPLTFAADEQVETRETQELKESAEVQVVNSVLIPDIRPLAQALAPSFKAVRQKLQDQFIDLRDEQRKVEKENGVVLPDSQDAYLAEDLMSGQIGQQLTENAEQVDSLISDIKEAGVDLAQVEELNRLLHAKERNQRLRDSRGIEDSGSGISDADADVRLQQLEAQGQLSQLQPFSQRLIDYNRETLQLKLDAGLITQETFDNLSQYQNYVPLKGIEGATEAEVLPPQAKGIKARRKQVQSARGRQGVGEALDTLSYSVAERNATIVDTIKNDASIRLFNFASAQNNNIATPVKPRRILIDNPSGAGGKISIVDPFWVQQNPQAVPVKIKGEEFFVEITEPRLARVWSKIGPQSQNVLMKGMQSVNRYLSAVLTQFNPDFILPNFVRDIQTAAINISENDITGLRRRLVIDTRKALPALWSMERGSAPSNDWQQEALNFARDGGKMVFFGQTDFDSLRKNIEKKASNKNPNQTELFRKAKSVLDVISDANTALENTTRLSAYVNLKRSGVDARKAAQVARNLTVNFTKKGEFGPIFNAYKLFFNAGIQGSARLMASAKNPKARRLMYGVIASGLIESIWNNLYSDDDEETGLSSYDLIPDHVKERNLVFMWPGSGKKYITIPLPYGFNTLAVGGRELGELGFQKKTQGDAAANIALSALNAFNPVSGVLNPLDPDVSIEKAATLAVTPSQIAPFVESAVNIDGLGRPVGPQRYPNDTTPDSHYQTQKAPISSAVTTRLNDLTGGSAVRDGAVDLSPHALSHWIESYAGGVGRTFLNSGAVANGLLRSDVDVEIGDIPVARRFFNEAPRWQVAGMYYALSDEIQTQAREKQIGVETGDLADKLGDTKKGTGLKGTKKKIKKLREQLNEATKDSEREKILDDIYREQARFIKETLGGDLKKIK